MVSVIPGNHDIHSVWARSKEGEEMAVVEQTNTRGLLNKFAGNGTRSRHQQRPESLSYVMEPKAGFPYLMIDTNIYSETKSTKAPKTEGKNQGRDIRLVG